MSSLPFISHHLFVAAVAHEQRPQAKPPANTDQASSSATQTTAGELASREFHFDLDAEPVSGALLVTQP